MAPTGKPTSPGWRCPPSPTRADVARIEGTIHSISASAQGWEAEGKTEAATRAEQHVTVWRERLAEVKAQMQKRRAALQMT